MGEAGEAPGAPGSLVAYNNQNSFPVPTLEYTNLSYCHFLCSLFPLPLQPVLFRQGTGVGAVPLPTKLCVAGF